MDTANSLATFSHSWKPNIAEHFHETVNGHLPE